MWPRLCLFLLQGGTAGAGQAAFEPQRPELERYAEATYSGTNIYLGGKVLEDLERALAAPDLAPAARIDLEAQLGDELIQAGEMERAIATLEGALESVLAQGLERLDARVRGLLALAYLRQAENRNCIERHNGDCCIFPFRKGGIHTVREPAEKAREQYEILLAKDPDDLDSLWLLNVLAMALGDYPGDVPERWRLPPESFASRSRAPLFRDIATQVGVDDLNLAGGAAVEDWDGDGWLDILTSTGDPRGSLIYHRSRGDGTFEDRSDASRASDQLGGLNLIAGDYDNDGDQDALILRGGWLADDGRIRKSLLRNEPGGTFLDATLSAGLGEAVFPSQTAAWADFDGDGWLDLYIGNESRLEISEADYSSQLFRSRGDGTFADVASSAGVENHRFAKGVAVGDCDNDGDLDLYVSNIGANRLYRNEGGLRFSDVASELGVTEPEGRSFACWFFDYDNDGWLDLLVWGYSTSIADLAAEALGRKHGGLLPCLYRNRRGVFRNATARAGLARPFLPMGANFGDIDNDGWLDIYLGTGQPALQALMPNVMLRNDGDRRFLDVTAVTGLGHLQKGHGIAFADFDHDGDQDIFHQLGGFFPVDRFHNALFENTGIPGKSHWLYLQLAGVKTNRDAVGARVRVVVETPSGTREIQRAPGCVSSFGGSPHRQEIGLGDATRIARLEIRWPNSPEPQVFEDVPLDACLRVTEGARSFERIELDSFEF